MGARATLAALLRGTPGLWPDLSRGAGHRCHTDSAGSFAPEAPPHVPSSRPSRGPRSPRAAPCWSGGGWGEGRVHSGRFHKRAPAMRGRGGPRRGAAGAPRGPGGKWGEQRFHRAAPHTDGPLHMIREHRAHCAVDLKVLTKRNYGKYKSEKLDQDAQPPEPGIHGASFPEPPLRGGAAGRWGEQGARPAAKTEPRERLHTRAPRHARSAPPNPHRTLDCARWA